MVAMRDGVGLATDIYFPAGHGRFPVVLERTPYGRDLISRSECTAANATPMTRVELAQIFTDAGYAVVFQDNRGRHGSEGRFVKYLSDAEDGFDLCTWLVAQPWCDGRICTMGLSYAAHTQAALGCLLSNVALNAIVIPRWGPIGCAWVTLATQTLWTVWLSRNVLRRLREAPDAPVELPAIDPSPLTA